MKSTNRNYGIDLLRLVSMMMVTLLHVPGQGGILNSAAALAIWFVCSIIDWVRNNIFKLFIFIENKIAKKKSNRHCRLLFFYHCFY